jgi:hypothetical protein
MKTANYNIVRSGDSWAIDHDGVLEGDYVTKEAAFEAVVAAASNSIKAGFGVSIKVEPRAPGETNVGGLG